MKSKFFKSVLVTASVILIINGLSAQFDDVYYDPESYLFGQGSGNSPLYETPASDDIVYYDNEHYEYVDDYDYYYSSRIQRFYRPYLGFGFYDPIYVGINYYDPWAYDYYAYPGASIYLSFGFGFNFFWNNWYYSPGGCYYGYNNWYYPSYTYWNGCGYYGGYYPPYYNNYCAPPGYYGGGWGGGHGNHYDDDDFHYGPRTAGNTGASPRSNWQIPGLVAPAVKDKDPGVADANGKPEVLPQPGIPGRVTQGTNPIAGEPVAVTDGKPISKTDPTQGGVRQIPVDKELTPGKTPTGPQRPVFKPDTDRFQPYPAPDRPANTTPQSGPDASTPGPITQRDRPTENTRPTPPTREQPQRWEESKPSSQRIENRQEDRPRYTPPPRPERNNDSTPSGSSGRSDNRPSYSAPQRSQDSGGRNDSPSFSPSRQDSGRSYDRPSPSSSSSGRDASSGSRSSSPSSSGSSSSSSRGRG